MNSDLSRPIHPRPSTRTVELRRETLLHKRASSCNELFRTAGRLSRISFNGNTGPALDQIKKCPPSTLETSSSRLSVGSRQSVAEIYQKHNLSEIPRDVSQKSSPLSERGVPEGQEDPETFASLNVLTEQKLIHASTPKQNSRLSSVLSLCRSVPNLQEFFKSFKQPSKVLSSKQKCAIDAWAKEKIANRVNLPLPPWFKHDLTKSDYSSFIETNDEQLCTNNSHEDSHELIYSSIDSYRINCGDKTSIKAFQCFQNFYSGNPLRRKLLITSKIISVIDSFSTTVWKSSLSNLDLLQVRWNYTTLLLRSMQNNCASEIFLNFTNPEELRSAASWMNILLEKSGEHGNIVTVESATHNRLYWKSLMTRWALQQGDDKDYENFELRYVGLAFFEESLCVLHDPSALSSLNDASYLMYKWSNSESWQAGYFQVQLGRLYQYDESFDQLPNLVLSLAEDECKGFGRNYSSARPHTVEIQYHDGKNLCLAAASESEADNWLTLLSHASTSDSVNFYKRPIACGVMVSDRDAILFHLAQNLKILSNTLMEAISVIRISPSETFCLVEFDYQEAQEGGGDWILYFQSANNLREFLNAMQCTQELLPEMSSVILQTRSSTLISSF